MIILIFGLVLFSCLNPVICQVQQLEPFIVGGEFSDIKHFPHSVCLTVKEANTLYICGSSVLNQRILLTAAHCLPIADPSHILIQYGNEHLPRAMKMSVLINKVYPDFTERDPFGDIALIKTPEPLIFNINVCRVAILPMKDTPYDEMSFVAGWGHVDEISETPTDRLKYIRQQILEPDECQKLIHVTLPQGVICGIGMDENSYASSGDSGSALIVRHYIQVGIVSYKNPVNRSVVMYTNVGFFYDWINKTTLELFCSSDSAAVEVRIVV